MSPSPLPVAARATGREERAPLHTVVNQAPIDEQLLAWMTLDPRIRDAVISRTTLAATPPEAIAFQAVVGGRRLPAVLAGHMRQEHTAVSHRRGDSAGQNFLRPCQGCGLVHGGPTVIIFQPLSKKAVCFYLFFFFWQFFFFFSGSRASSKA
jgi:hypothetical protein